MQLQLINNRITPIIEGNFSDRQMRLRKGKGTRDAFFISELHCVSKKNKQNYFCYNYVKLPPNLTIFGTMMANCPKII